MWNNKNNNNNNNNNNNKDNNNIIVIIINLFRCSIYSTCIVNCIHNSDLKLRIVDFLEKPCQVGLYHSNHSLFCLSMNIY